MNTSLLLLFSLLNYIIFSTSQTASQDQVNLTQLFSGQTAFLQQLGSTQLYSGFLNISSTRALHYFYFPYNGPAAAVNSSIPVAFWLTGGPGCSSLGAAISENGPFYFEDYVTPLKPIFNEYAWNQAAHLVYLETPAGVGFSTKTDTDPQNDYTVAVDNAAAMNIWLDRFNLRVNPTFIVGESYAGVYVPYFSWAVDNWNNQPQNQNKLINFKGWATGNGCTDLNLQCSILWQEPDLRFLYQQGIITFQNYTQAIDTCFGCDLNDQIQLESQDCLPCTNLQLQLEFQTATDYSGSGPFLNYYDIYRTCPSGTTAKNFAMNPKRLEFTKKMIKKYFPEKEVTANDNGTPCIAVSSGENFFNNQTVRQILHLGNFSANFTWEFCFPTTVFQFYGSPNGSYWIYKELIPEKKYRVMIYSGNTDLAVPIAGTRAWIDQLRQDINMVLIEPWRSWYITPPQPSSTSTPTQTYVGSTETYDGLFFASVNGVGHMVPQWQRQGALQLLQSFLYNTDLPYYSS
eukprot:TRINITY_DN1295_c0_g1_i4.p1 TRINITY_DN1295_c0_g1~~TRINITY_DN1295_c0_g1_i4.p1  ORF type:complete len:515 (+),score=44.11 TRINITY_DN1295_c0_g1_i4:205-1749(+)